MRRWEQDMHNLAMTVVNAIKARKPEYDGYMAVPTAEGAAAMLGVDEETAGEAVEAAIALMVASGDYVDLREGLFHRDELEALDAELAADMTDGMYKAIYS